MGELARARECLERSFTYDDPQQRYSSPVIEPRVDYFSQLALVLYLLGYPDQALKSNQAGRILAEELSHPFSAALTENFAAILHQLRGERQRSQERVETLMVLSREQGFALWVAMGMILQVWALTEQRHASITQVRQGLAALRTTGTGMFRPYFLALLAEVYGGVGQVEEGLTVLAEAVDIVHSSKERWYEAELYRLKGELTLQQFKIQGSKFKVENSLGSSVQSLESEAEECFLKAIEVARRQQAKSWELRASTSLAQLWRSQGKRKEAYKLLAEIYGWFTEGFDTKDLQEAKALSEELA
jgi:predicted ATPase